MANPGIWRIRPVGRSIGVRPDSLERQSLSQNASAERGTAMRDTVQPLPASLARFRGETVHSPSRPSEPPAEIHDRIDPSIARHTNPLENRSQFRRYHAPFVLACLAARPIQKLEVLRQLQRQKPMI